MSHLSNPSVTLNIVAASQLAGVQDQKVLILGQMLAAGNAVSGTLIQDMPNDGSEDSLFVQDSHLAGMVREFKKLNIVSQLDVLPVDDATGTQATAVLAVSGPSNEAGSIFVTVCSAKNHRYEIAIESGDDATTIGDAIVAAFDADDDIPTTQANLTGTVTFTSTHDGTLSDEWDIKVEGAVGGVGITLTGWTGGATDPTLTGLLDAIANIRYQTVIWPSSWDISVLETELNTRFNLTNDIKDGRGIQIKRGTLALLKTYANFNSQSIVIVGNKTVDIIDHKGSATPEMPDIMAAQAGAERALRLTEGANLTEFLTTVARSDQFGGISIASLPYFNTALPNLPIANAADFFSPEEQAELEDNGVALIGPNSAFNETIFGPMVTTYLTDVAANADTSYKYLNTVDTASVIREFFVTNYKSRYAQTRLTNGDLIAGRDMANTASIRAFSRSLYGELADDALVQAGGAALKDFDDNLIVSLDISTGIVTIDMAPLLVSQLRVIIGTIQINFG